MKLAIVIPTCNRPNILQETVMSILDCITKYNVMVYIYDSSDNNETELVASRLMSKSSHIMYFKNKLKTEYDENCIAALKMAKEDYVWLLSDSMFIKVDAFPFLLNKINQSGADYISLNVVNRRIDIKSSLFKDLDQTLILLGWHLTQLGTTIFSRRVLAELDLIKIQDVKNFVQVAIIFNGMARYNSSLLWVNDRYLSINKAKKPYWTIQAIHTFTVDWVNVILSLNKKFSLEAKLKCIMNHGIYSGLFSWLGLLVLRSSNLLNYKIYKRYKFIFPITIKYPNFIIMVLSLIPKRPIKVSINLGKLLKIQLLGRSNESK